jgi:hypothetical protein
VLLESESSHLTPRPPPLPVCAAIVLITYHAWPAACSIAWWRSLTADTRRTCVCVRACVTARDVLVHSHQSLLWPWRADADDDIDFDHAPDVQVGRACVCVRRFPCACVCHVCVTPPSPPPLLARLHRLKLTITASGRCRAAPEDAATSAS